MKRTALVVSGGGCRGAFAVGALRYLVDELGMSFDIGAGTSTGSLIVPMVLIDKLPVLERIYSTVTTPEVVRTKFLPLALLFGDSLYGVEPLHRLIEENFSEADFRALVAGGKQSFVTTTCIQTGDNQFFKAGAAHPADATYPNVHPVASRETYVRAILASCCQPLFMPPIEIHPGLTPVRQYWDGGVMDVTPAEIAIEYAATDMIVLDLDPAQDPDGQVYGRPPPLFFPLGGIFTRGLELFLASIEGADLTTGRVTRYVNAVKTELETKHGWSRAAVEELFSIDGNPFKGRPLASYTVIRPEKALPAKNALAFDPPVMREMMQMGFDRAKAVMAQRRETTAWPRAVEPA